MEKQENNSSAQGAENKTCRHCQSKIHVIAKKCPNCHGDLRRWPARHPILSILGTLFIIGIIMASTGGTEQVAKEKSQLATEVKITAVELSREYDKNKVLADQKYEDKILEITGTIDNIGKDILDTPYVSLKGIPTLLFGVQCMFSRHDENELAQLSKDQKITLKGKVGGELIGNIIVRDCSIVK